MARVILAVLAAFACSAEAFSVAPASAVVRQQSAVQMNTQFTDPFVQKMKKKGKTGSTKSLKGYTVGSRAPKVAINSGTTVDRYKTNGGLDQAAKNKQNVPTIAVIGVPILLIAVSDLLGKTWLSS